MTCSNMMFSSFLAASLCIFVGQIVDVVSTNLSCVCIYSELVYTRGLYIQMNYNNLVEHLRG